MHVVVLRPFVHRSQEVIGQDAPYIRELDLTIRQLKGVKWSQTNKVWYLPLGKATHKAIRAAFQNIAVVDESLSKRYLHVSKKNLVNIVSHCDDLWSSGKVEW